MAIGSIMQKALEQAEKTILAKVEALVIRIVKKEVANGNKRIKAWIKSEYDVVE